MKSRFEVGRGPIRHAGWRSSATLSERGIWVARGVALAPILAERVQPGSLFIIQEVVKFLQRRVNRPHCGNHRLNSFLHGSKARWRRQRYLFRACRLNILCGFHRSVSEIIQRGALGFIRLNGLLDFIDRKACDAAAVLTAQSRQLVGHHSPRAAYPSCFDPRTAAADLRTAAAWWQIPQELVVAIRREQAGINVVVAVIPERVIVA